MIAPVIPSLLCLLLQAAPLQDEKPRLTRDDLLELVREAMPAVERITGRKFRDPVWVRVSTSREVQRALTEELNPQMKILQPEATEEQGRDLAERLAGIYGRILIAKYAWKTGTIHVIPESIARMASTLEMPALLDRSVLRVIVTHELVHALDHQEHGLFKSLGDVKSVTDLEIRNAISEGHAQHVTRRVFEAAGELAAFDTYEKSILAGPPGILGEAEKYLANVMMSSLKLAYVDGRAFFDALEKTGRATYVEDVFGRPPTRKNVILKPERFYGGKEGGAGDFDPAAAFESFGKEFGLEWTRRSQELDHGTLRATFGDFIPAKDVDAVLEEVLQGHMLVLSPKRAPESKLVAVAILRATDPASAKRAFEASVRVSKVKDAKFTGVPFKIAKASYGTLPLPADIVHVLIRKTIAVQDQVVEVASVAGCEGEFEFEIVLSNEEADDARIKSMVERLCGALRKK